MSEVSVQRHNRLSKVVGKEESAASNSLSCQNEKRRVRTSNLVPVG